MFFYKIMGNLLFLYTYNLLSQILIMTHVTITFVNIKNTQWDHTEPYDLGFKNAVRGEDDADRKIRQNCQCGRSLVQNAFFYFRAEPVPSMYHNSSLLETVS